jgi:predicted GTPase
MQSTSGVGNRNEDGRLRLAVAHAVRDSLEEAGRLRSQAIHLTDAIVALAEELGVECGSLLSEGRAGTAERKAVTSFDSVIRDSAKEVRTLFERQGDNLKTFNLALFGRTGAGKSTLIEAMTGGNGASVSEGESDWTTVVSAREWEGCRIYDTPGINGWGRTQSREGLEEKARHAVEVADFVLVCFDSQSQQAEEFRKVAKWVHTYNKPLIAILNARNPVWRFPERVPSRLSRQNLADQIRQHASNISDELGKIGLPGVPIVAMSSQRALFARARLPFQGPGKVELQRLREDYGAERLIDLSNFRSLQDLLEATISLHAVALRLGVLRDQLRGAVDGLVGDLEGNARAFHDAADLLEKDYIQPMLRFVGYPAAKDAEKRSWFRNQGAEINILDQVELLRGGRFASPVQGNFRQFVLSRIGAELGIFRQRSLRRADDLIDEAFDHGKEVTSAYFEESCLDKELVEAACTRVMEQAGEFLKRETRLLAADLEIDLKASSQESGGMASFEGRSAMAQKNWGRAFKVGGIVAGAGSALALTLAIGTANAWNPLGWVMLGAGAVSMFFGWLGSKNVKEAQKRKLQARQKASGEARTAIHRWYDAQESRFETSAEQWLREAVVPVLVEPLCRELVLLKLERACREMQNQAKELVAKLPVAACPTGCVWDGMKIVEKAKFPKRDRRAEFVWLGEDWLEDQTGLREDEKVYGPTRTRANDPGLFERLATEFRRFFQGKATEFSVIPGREWFHRAFELMADDELGREKLAELEELDQAGRPRICFVGDYNSGKSSLIKRLLIDDGQPVPEELEVRGNPTTTGVAQFDWGGVQLVDTPGFQSGNDVHDWTTLQDFSSAALVVYVFHPNLILGDEGAMRLVLNGCRSRGLVPKKRRTIFLINRADELGCDAPKSPERFRTLVERKKTELSLALASRGIEIAPEQILCVASDPYGLIGDRRDASPSLYDANRSWDGIRAFHQAFRELKPELLTNGKDHALLEGGLSRLASTMELHNGTIEGLCLEVDALRGLVTQLDKAIGEGHRLADAEVSKVARHIQVFTDNLIEQCMAANGPGKLQEMSEEVNKWWEHPGLASELAHWCDAAAKHFTEWCEQVEDQVQRRWESREFRSVIKNHVGAEYQYRGPVDNAHRAPEGIAAASRLMKGASREVVLEVGRAVGFKFKPWGAVKMAKNLSKAGAVLAWIGVAWDVVEFARAEQRAAKEEEERKRMREAVASEVPDVVKSIAYGRRIDDSPDSLEGIEDGMGASALGDDADVSGIVAQFERVLADYTRRSGDVVTNIEARESRIDALKGRVMRYQVLFEEAEGLLGHPWKNEQV